MFQFVLKNLRYFLENYKIIIRNFENSEFYIEILRNDTKILRKIFARNNKN